MTISEKFELILIPVLSSAVWFVAFMLPSSMRIGYLVLMASTLLLIQSLIRDLWLLYRAVQQSKQKEADHKKHAPCMCLESTIGISGVIAGILLTSIFVSKPLHMPNWGWSLCVFFVLGFGFLIKDYVFEWNPWRIRRVKDHLNIVVTWKAQQ